MTTPSTRKTAIRFSAEEARAEVALDGLGTIPAHARPLGLQSATDGHRYSHDGLSGPSALSGRKGQAGDGRARVSAVSGNATREMNGAPGTRREGDRADAGPRGMDAEPHDGTIVTQKWESRRRARAGDSDRKETARDESNARRAGGGRDDGNGGGDSIKRRG
jgi:hypothetical protein